VSQTYTAQRNQEINTNDPEQGRRASGAENIRCIKKGRSNMEIKIVKDSISKKELADIAKRQFGNLVKAVVDVGQGIMAIGGEMHADEEVALIEKEGSKREYTWGINLYPEKAEDDLIEFDSVINLKPSSGNRSRGIDDPKIKEKIRNIIKKLVL